MTLVSPATKVELMTGAAVIACTVTEFEAIEIDFPDAVAFAVMAWPVVKAVRPVLLQALLVTVVVVPTAPPSA